MVGFVGSSGRAFPLAFSLSVGRVLLKIALNGEPLGASHEFVTCSEKG
jgi:hypothetical protein